MGHVCGRVGDVTAQRGTRTQTHRQQGHDDESSVGAKSHDVRDGIGAIVTDGAEHVSDLEASSTSR